MIMSFSTALSGLKSASTTLSVTGNNIANSQTVGFKQSRAQFGEVMAGQNTAGIGTRVTDIAQQFTQGNIEGTANSLDLAISGQGFFAMGDLVDPVIPDKPLEATSFTRNGAFHINRSGNIVDDNGRYLLAYKPVGMTLAEGFNVGVKLPLRIDTDQGPPTETSQVNMQVNLNESAKPAISPFAFTTPGTTPYVPDPKTYNSTTSVTTYDSMGNAHILSTYFCKTDVPNEWKLYAFLDGKSIEPGVQADPYSIPPISAKGSSVLAEGVITTQPSMVYFDDKGNLLKVSSVQQQTDRLRSSAWAAASKFSAAKDKVVTLDSKVAEADAAVAMYQKQYDKVSTTEPLLQNVINDAKDTLDASIVAQAAAVTNRDAAIIDRDAAGAASDAAAALFNEQVAKDLEDAKAIAQASPAGTSLPSNALAVDFGGIDITAINPDIKVKDMTIKLNFASSTQFASPFIVNDLKQNGLPVGSLSSVDVDPTGVVFAKYSNGYSKPIGQVALVNFANPLALEKISGTTWKGSSDAGQAVYGQAGGNNFGAIRSSSLENSNVDLSEQLVKLIVAQQAYQANSQAISIQKTLTESVLRI
jgi:flagellar hook protein FlgE